VEEGGTPDAGALAGDIGTALVTTMLGLIIAIPALGVYSWMRSRIDELSSEAMMAAQELISTFRPGRGKK
jgi:biopolymer transport protein ExbB